MGLETFGPPIAQHLRRSHLCGILKKSESIGGGRTNDDLVGRYSTILSAELDLSDAYDCGAGHNAKRPLIWASQNRVQRMHR